MEYASRKIALPKETVPKERFPVRRSQIDTNEHLNNCQYNPLAVELKPESESAAQVREEYKRTAEIAAQYSTRTAVEALRKVIELCDENGGIFAVVEFE